MSIAKTYIRLGLLYRWLRNWYFKRWQQANDLGKYYTKKMNEMRDRELNMYVKALAAEKRSKPGAKPQKDPSTAVPSCDSTDKEATRTDGKKTRK